MNTDIDIDALLERMRQPGPVDDDPVEREPDYMTDNQADREYAEDADRAADRYEKEMDARWE